MVQHYSVSANQPPTLEPAMIYRQPQESFCDSNLDPEVTESHDTRIDNADGQINSSNFVYYPKSTGGALTETGNQSRRGPFKDPFIRAQTAQTRKDNACLRCRMQRIRVGAPSLITPFEPYSFTSRVCARSHRPSRSLSHLQEYICSKDYQTTLPSLENHGYKTVQKWLRAGHVWSERWKSNQKKDISTWADTEIRTIEVTQDYSPRPMKLKVRRFIPVEGDMLSRSWVHGSVKKSVTLPPYAIVSIKEAEKTYLDFVNSEGTEFFVSTLSKDDKLVWETYDTAIHASNNSMVSWRSLISLDIIDLYRVNQRESC